MSNGQSEIKFTKLEFARPEPVAAQFDPDEGFTGLVSPKHINSKLLKGQHASLNTAYSNI